jgi:NAD(P)-dependent dehydrogenase (short-subunit alcohol dehydrogenase family)
MSGRKLTKQRLISFLVLTVLCCSSVFASVATNKTVLITGGLSGIGRDLTLAFQKDGWDVWATSRDPKSHENIPGVTIRKVDITNEKEVKDLVKEIQASRGHLDVLINNAGYGIIGPQEAVSIEQAKDILNVNVIGPLMLTQEVLPLMRSNKGGHIINISSTSGLRAVPGLGVYAASKMALEGLSEAFAAELAPWNIKVVIIEPGTTKNSWAKNAPLAAKLNDYPGYKSFSNKLQNSLSAKAIETGQNPSEIAQLALKIAKSDKPNLRYQTNTQSASVAGEVLIDPTGNLMRDKMAKFAKEHYDLPSSF